MRRVILVCFGILHLITITVFLHSGIIEFKNISIPKFKFLCRKPKFFSTQNFINFVDIIMPNFMAAIL